MKKKPLSGLSEKELVSLAKSHNWPAFKGKEISSWLNKKHIGSFDEITSLSKTERDLIKERYSISPFEMHTKEVSNDGTIKYLWKLNDGMLVESVRMHMEGHGSNTACISSQVGCAIGCIFCATGKLGLKRNLKSYEIVDQVLSIQRDTKERIRNIVLMGQGEPLQNLDEVLTAIDIIREDVGIGSRHITLSTSGLPKQLKQLAEKELPITLAFSLHAANQETREFLVPTAKHNHISKIMESLHYYYGKTKRRITVEYVLLDGINDSLDDAKELGQLVRNLHCHINLIPYNPIDTSNLQIQVSSLKRPIYSKMRSFQDLVEKVSKKKVTLRKERGVDINAACGQLANSVNQ